MNCPKCDGRGWILTEKRGISGAERCACSLPARSAESQRAPTPEEYTQALAFMAAAIPFFPDEPMVQAFIIEQIGARIQTIGELQGFVQTAAKAGKWDGLGALLAVYDAACERRYLQRESEDHDRRLLAAKDNLKLLGEAPQSAEEVSKIVTESEPPAPPEKPAHASPRWLKDLLAPASGRADEVDLRPLKQVEEDLAATPRRPRRTPEETRRLVEEVKRAVLERLPAAGSVH